MWLHRQRIWYVCWLSQVKQCKGKERTSQGMYRLGREGDSGPWLFGDSYRKTKTSLCWPKPKTLRTQVWLNKHPQRARHFWYMLILFLLSTCFLSPCYGWGAKEPDQCCGSYQRHGLDSTQVSWIHVYTYLEVPIPDLSVSQSSGRGAKESVFLLSGQRYDFHG